MRFLLTPRWLRYGLVAVLASVVMIMLGRWQWSRYEMRHAINERIDASTVVAAVPLSEVLPPPGRSPTDAAQWIRTGVTGRYDPANEILLRNRTVEGRIGYEVITPLLLPDGSAVLVDRGWVPPDPKGMSAAPQVPAAPAGDVSVTGRVHLSESGATAVERRNGRLETRRAAVPALAAQLPYPVYSAYLLADEGTPGSSGLVAIPVGHENDWLNFGYAFQWWIFAGGALYAYYWLARREQRRLSAPAIVPV